MNVSITKNKYLISKNAILRQINKLKDEDRVLEKRYIEANALCKIGDKFIYDHEFKVEITNITAGFDGDITYHFNRILISDNGLGRTTMTTKDFSLLKPIPSL